MTFGLQNQYSTNWVKQASSIFFIRLFFDTLSDLLSCKKKPHGLAYISDVLMRLFLVLVLTNVTLAVWSKHHSNCKKQVFANHLRSKGWQVSADVWSKLTFGVQYFKRYFVGRSCKVLSNDFLKPQQFLRILSAYQIGNNLARFEPKRWQISKLLTVYKGSFYFIIHYF